MDRLCAEAWRIFVVLVTFIMTCMILLVSADCNDPGIPVHGSRTVSNKNGRFPLGTVVSFSCNAHYTMVGAKKIACIFQKNEYLWNGKVPICNSQGCPLPPPAFAHASITTHPIYNSKGSYVNYACDSGYLPDHHPTRVLCDKDPTVGYVWSGNFTCKKKTCGRPPLPSTGHGGYRLTSNPGGTIFTATYYCNSGYVLRTGARITDRVTRYCGQSGDWSSTTPVCVRTCISIDDQLGGHGYLRSRTPNYFNVSIQYVDTQGVTVTFVCANQYRLEGSSTRTCLQSGYWSGVQAHCVLSSCGSPGGLIHGRITSNSTSQSTSLFPIWTTVTFTCHTGYKLVGPSSRQCRPNGEWTEQSNPTCKWLPQSGVTCRAPDQIPHGYYVPHKSVYHENDTITYVCDWEQGYFLWGEQDQLKCQNMGGLAAWFPVCHSFCHVPNGVIECLLPAVFDDRCMKTTGNHAKFTNKKAFCSSSSDSSPTAKLISIKSSRDSELDKMTIVVATAGSTLGALVVLLTALVCFRRFHRSRRFRRSSFRSRRYSDDDRIAIIAAYTGDVHFILPSYDEAISQVESLPPPPFESVVQGAQDRGNQTAAANSVPTGDEAVNHTGPDSSAGDDAANSAVANDTAVSTREVGSRAAEDQPINVVSNPLADSASAARETVESSDHVLSAVNEGVNLSQESLDSENIGLPPNNPSEDLQSSSSEDDLTSSQTQPLLGNSRRGVMV